MLAAAVFVISMIWFMHKTARTMRGDIEQKIAHYTGEQRRLEDRPLLLRLPPRPSRRRRNRPDPLRRHPQLDRDSQLHRNPPRHRRRRRLRRPVHSRQRQDQPAALLPRHHGHPLLRRLPAHRQRPARAQRKRRPSLQPRRDALHRSHRPQRPLLLRHHARPRRPDDSARIQPPRSHRRSPPTPPPPTSAAPSGPSVAKRCG